MNKNMPRTVRHLLDALLVLASTVVATAGFAHNEITWLVAGA